MRNKGSTLT